MSRDQQKNLLMWGLYALYFLAVCLLQSVYLGQFTVADVHIFLIPVAVSSVCVCVGAEYAGTFALAAGLFWALMGGSDGATVLVCLTVSGCLSGYLCDAVFTRRLASAVVMALLSLTVTLVGVALVRAYLDGFGLWTLKLCLRQLIFSVPFAPALYWVAKTIRKAGA